MKIKREISIAIVVGCAMLIICVIAIVAQKSVDEPINLKVYKLFESGIEGDVGSYYECTISTEDVIKVKKEFDRMNALSDSNILSGETIKGSYKVILNDDKFLAFDNNTDNVVYNGTKNRIYNFSSEMYDIVINTCG